MSANLERVELNPVEAKRTYNFPNGQKVSYENVVAVFKNTGSTGRIETLNDGKTMIHIINNSWLTIDIDSAKFTV